MLLIEIYNKQKKLILTMDRDCNITTKDKRLRKTMLDMTSVPFMESLGSQQDGSMCISCYIPHNKGTEAYLRCVYNKLMKRMLKDERSSGEQKVFIRLIDDQKEKPGVCEIFLDGKSECQRETTSEMDDVEEAIVALFGEEYL